jgi:hypothetical protein
MTPISPDEEDVRVERSCCGDGFLRPSLRAKVSEG